MITIIIYLLLALFSFILSFMAGGPYLLKLRYFDTLLVIAVGLHSTYALLGLLLRHQGIKRGLCLVSIAVFVFNVTFCTYKAWREQYLEQIVLNAPKEQLQKLGAHFIVGFDDYNAIEQLVKKGAVAGIFISKRNIKNKTFDQVKQQIATLQNIQKKHSRPPLFVTADHEGGIVSHLSPMLTKLPALSSVLEQNYTVSEQNIALEKYAHIHGSELANLGINVNFGPVVDLKNKHTKIKINGHTRIYQRAISTEPRIINQVAINYIKILEQYGVLATIKHFPGLGNVSEDTHFVAGELNTTPNELFQKDWIPFIEIPKRTRALMMVGHVKLPTLDKNQTASTSKKIIQHVVRGKFGFEGLIVTDDFSMGPIYSGKDGVTGSAVKTLNAGVDLILVSYDPRLYFKAMYALMRADKNGELSHKMLLKSQKRILLNKKWLSPS